MKAICWYGSTDVRVENVPDPKILNPHDAIVRMTCTTICGSDLHLYSGLVPTVEKGDIIGHEFMGEIVQVGPEVKRLKKGDRVVVISVIACGQCSYCNDGLWSLCDNSNPNAVRQEKVLGYSTAAIFGYSHLFGGYAGAFAEYVRIPFAENSAFKVPDNIPDEKLVFISDSVPTGYMGAENCDIKHGDIVAVWGAGAVGLFAMKSAQMLGAEKVVAIDRFQWRLDMAKEHCNAICINYESENVIDVLKDITAGRGPDKCIDAVGMEATTTGVADLYVKAKQAVRLETDRPHVLRDAIMSCRKGGTVSVLGVYAGLVDKVPFGALFNKALIIRSGQMNGQKYAPMLIDKVIKKELDPSFVVTHKMKLDQAPEAFKIFRDKKENCVRIILRP